MGVEIERKFLVRSSEWQKDVVSEAFIAQGYISVRAEHTVRVRIKEQAAYLTLKGRGQGLVRPEFEYEIPLSDARAMFETFCKGRSLEKRRFEVPFAGHLFEVDVFEGENSGLVLAEVELQRPDEEVDLPPWIGEEVTGDVRYYNARLVVEPFCQWAPGE